MTVTALTSINGSPGVTSTALTWAQVSTRPTLLVEADPTGGSSLLCIGWQGAQSHDRSVLDLAHFAPTDFPQRIWDLVLPLPQRPKAAWLLPGVGTNAQATTFGDLWAGLGDALRRISVESDIDVVIDMGRWNSRGFATALLNRADAVLVMTDTTLPALSSLSLGLDPINEHLESAGAARRLAVVPLLGNEKGSRHRPYTAREVRQVTHDIPVLHGVTRDAKAAGERTWGRDRQRMRWVDRLIRPHSGYPFSVQALIEATSAHAARADGYITTDQEHA